MKNNLHSEISKILDASWSSGDIPIKNDGQEGNMKWRVNALLTLIKKHERGLLEEGKEIGISNVGRWYDLPEYKDFNSACSVCGGKPVTIRGKYPKTPKRKICPTCTREVLEGIYESCNNRTASEAKLKNPNNPKE